MEPYPEDIIEEALQHGLKAAAARFNMPIENIKPIVREFTDEIDSALMSPCTCDALNASGKGSTMGCFIPCPKKSGAGLRNFIL
jgi:hypothetical protein